VIWLSCINRTEKQVINSKVPNSRITAHQVSIDGKKQFFGPFMAAAEVMICNTVSLYTRFVFGGRNKHSKNSTSKSINNLDHCAALHPNNVMYNTEYSNCRILAFQIPDAFLNVPRFVNSQKSRICPVYGSSASCWPSGLAAVLRAYYLLHNTSWCHSWCTRTPCEMENPPPPPPPFTPRAVGV
jgi:hypothetical protein